MKKNYKKPLMVAVTIDDNILAGSIPFTLELIDDGVNGNQALGKRRGGSLDLEDEEEEEDE